MTSVSSMIMAKPSSNTYLSDLDAPVFLEITQILDLNHTWKKLINVLPGSHYKAEDVQKFEDAYTRPSGSPSFSLLMDMGHKGFKVCHLIGFLERLQLERALVYIKDFQPVQMSRPMQTLYIVQGGPCTSLEIECTAVGFPAPTFQWFKLMKGDLEEWMELVGQNSNILNIKPVRLEDSGKYNCRFSNIDYATNEQSYAFTDVITVIVEHDVVFDRETDTSHLQLVIPPAIHRQPSCPAKGPFYQGSTIVLECIAVGTEPLSYEWFKNGIKIPGEEGGTLHIINQPEDDVVRFKYQCRVFNSFGSVQSEVVTVMLAPPRDGSQFLAEDKVALLIANDEYEEHAGLRSAITDAVTVAQLLRKLEFKVLVAVNLDEESMRNMVSEFCKLLDSGVYGVFYYAGHGFEVNKQCYMMPIDAAKEYCCEQCICVDEVKGKMQSRNPALCCLLLDMCRKDPDCDSFDASRGYRLYQSRVDRNVICAYATSYSCSALDGPAGKNGLFVKHLRNYITKELPIEVVLNHVLEDISVDPAASKKQFPAISEKTLAQTRRSLADHIHAMLPNCHERNSHYLSMIQKPNNFMIRCETTDTLQIHVTFDMEEHVVCNVLVVHIQVTDRNGHPQQTFTSCLGNLKPEVDKFEKKIYMRDNLEQRIMDGESQAIVTLRNLQKLKDPLIIQGNLYHDHRIVSVWPEKSLDFPMLSNVAQHWRQEVDKSRPSMAIEDDESGIGSFCTQLQLNDSN